jgi:hypothetical protein
MVRYRYSTIIAIGMVYFRTSLWAPLLHYRILRMNGDMELGTEHGIGYGLVLRIVLV